MGESLTPRVVLAFVVWLPALASAQEGGRPPRQHALLVTVSQYQPGQPLDALPRTEADIANLKAPPEAGGYKVQLLSPKAATASGTLDLGLLPTADVIEARLKAAAGSQFLDSRDTVLVVLSGHGVTVKAKASPAGEAEDVFCFCPADANLKAVFERTEPPTVKEPRTKYHLVPMQDVYTQLETDCAAGLKVLIADCCRNNPSAPATTRAASTTLPRLPPPRGGVIALFSCSPLEKAYEDPDLGHGVFFHYLLKGLSADAPHAADRTVTLGELYDYASYETETFVTEKYRAGQTPNLTGDLRGQAVLLRLPADALSSAGASPPAMRPESVASSDKASTLPKRPAWEGTAAGEARELAPDLGITLAWCPPGTFTIGSPASEPDRDDGETQHRVTLTRGLWLGRTEVTQAQWKAVMGTEPWRYSLGGAQYGVQEGADNPAAYLSWDDTLDFCEKLTMRERAAGRLPAGYEYCLPTEAQWEYAC